MREYCVDFNSSSYISLQHTHVFMLTSIFTSWRPAVTLTMKYRTLNKYRIRNSEKKPKVVIFERNNKINKLYGREIIISGRNIFALIISNKLKCGGCAGRFRSESPIIYRTHCRSVIILCFILLCNVVLCYYRA